MARSGPKAGQVAITLANLIPLVDVGADLMEASIVYRSLNAAGDVNYVGITNNLARRAAEQLTGRGLQIEKLMGGLSRSDARSVEQALIEIHGLGKNGGSLLNKINSIAVRNPAYATQLSRGYDLLRTIGY
jgi:excinuclease UvrABC nuclease subunit